MLEDALTLPESFTARFGDAPADAPYFAVWRADGDLLKASAAPAGAPPLALPPMPAENVRSYEVRQRGDYREVVMAAPRGCWSAAPSCGK